LNWGFVLLRAAIGLSVLALLFLSQRFWYRALWRVTGNWGKRWLRIAARASYILVLVLIVLAVSDGFRTGHGRILPRGTMINILAGLWFTSALFAFLSVKFVRALDWIWRFARLSLHRPGAQPTVGAGADVLPNPSRRYFFRTATMAAGVAPFVSVMYGFAAERLNYQIREAELPIANLPPALNGLKIAQLSDIHMSGYMPRSQVRRAVDMANELNADIAFVTGDFITGARDPLGECIDELSRLRAPFGVWGCNGNHEIYARAEEAAQQYFARYGMRLLRSENAQIAVNGASFNLIGVDYQRERALNSRRVQMLPDIEPLIRRDMPNILLSHNPNSFNRACELGIELSLAGHTHGGQIQVEILDHRLSPARFITDYVAGVYHRPLFLPAHDDRAWHAAHSTSSQFGISAVNGPLSVLYVNRGLGTVGAPVRLGVPPEITLLTLRRSKD
jgi:predicted MPP superfamily phosphohydrolase